MNKLFTILLYLLIYINLQAQDRIISGKVLDQEQVPVELAIVYISNTSIFTYTDSTGYFSLEIPEKFLSNDCWVERVGFQKRKINTNSSTDQRIILEYDQMLNEVVVTTKRDKEWEKKLKFFKRFFFGNHKFSKECRFLNPEVLEFDGNSKNLTITCNQPLVFINNALGYKVFADFQNMKLREGSYNIAWNSIRFESFSGNSLTANQLKNRVELFQNSLPGYVYSLVNSNGSTKKSKQYEAFRWLGLMHYPSGTSLGHELAIGRIIPFNGKEYMSYDTTTNKYNLSIQDPLLIFNKKSIAVKTYFSDMKYDYFSINLNGKKNLQFDKNGRIYSAFITERLGNNGGFFSTVLPADYIPKTN